MLCGQAISIHLNMYDRENADYTSTFHVFIAFWLIDKILLAPCAVTW